MEDERLLSERVADEAWTDAYPTASQRPLPPHPVFVQFAGTPLCGKSTISRALAHEVPTATVHAENDMLRDRVALHLGRPPVYDRFENFVTYQTAWQLSTRAFGAGMHALHDATNLTEGGRRQGYALADAEAVPVFVVFVLTDDATLERRLAAVPPERQAAFEKFRGLEPEPDDCTRPHVVLDGARPVDENLRLLAAQPELAALWRPGPQLPSQPHTGPATGT